MIRRALAVAALGAAIAGCGHHSKTAASTTAAQQTKGLPPPTQHFVSRPDLRPPPVKILTRAHGTAPGLIFIAPKMKVVQAGPMILDNGQVVWFHPLDTHGVSDFKVQHYQGKPVLTWWRGHAPMGVGSGYYAIYDDRYHQIAQVRAGNGLTGDIHEFLITPDDKALFTVYHQLHVDLTAYGGPKEGRIFDGIVQEVDIPTGRVLWEWHSYPEVGLRESYAPPPKKSAGKKAAPWDYFHINSIDVEPNGNFLISARNTHTLYELSRRTKKILWRLGGKKSDFKMGPGTNFEWQHDARSHAGGTITLFDNGATPPAEKFTRILRLRVSPATRRVTLVKSLHHPQRLLVPFEGNAQVLPDGHVFVGWGGVPYFTEFDASGHVMLDARFGKLKGRITGPNQDADSYRAFRFVWHGRPTDQPAVATLGHKVYVSWNGATDVRKWQLLDDGEPGATRAKTGFETSLPVPEGAKKLAVRALSASGVTLGTSNTITP